MFVHAMRREFDESLGLPHDFIDVTCVKDRQGEVYPEVLNLIETD